MGLDIYALRNPQSVKAEATADDDWDNGTRISNDAPFVGHADGLPEGFYSGEMVRHRGWSYGGYNRLREIICRAAFGVEPKEFWREPHRYSQGDHGGLVPLVFFSDCEGAIGPRTSAKIADALERLGPIGDPDGDSWDDGRIALIGCFRDAAEHNGFAVWR